MFTLNRKEKAKNNRISRGYSIPLTKERATKVDQIFKHPVGNGFYYSVYLKATDEVFWCDTVSEIYRVIDEN